MPRRILYFTQGCYLDDSNGAAVASRALTETLTRRGFGTEVVSGAMLDLDREIDPAAWLAENGWAFEERRGDPSGLPPYYRLNAKGVPVTLHRSPSTKLHDDDGERTIDYGLRGADGHPRIVPQR